MQLLELLVKSVTSNITRIFIVAINLQPVRKIFCEIFKNTFFYRTPLVAASILKRLSHSRHKIISHSRHKKCIALETQQSTTFVTQKSATSEIFCFALDF